MVLALSLLAPIRKLHAQIRDAVVAWVGYANGDIRSQIEPLLHAALRTRNLIEGS